MPRISEDTLNLILQRLGRIERGPTERFAQIDQRLDRVERLEDKWGQAG